MAVFNHLDVAPYAVGGISSATLFFNNGVFVTHQNSVNINASDLQVVRGIFKVKHDHLPGFTTGRETHVCGECSGQPEHALDFVKAPCFSSSPPVTAETKLKIGFENCCERRRYRIG
ncbi:MAG: hypothetical protein KJ630_19550 [Proteobacteria bacterium]|nr:hypothetical protein [Pseudomonadota bacterium]